LHKSWISLLVVVLPVLLIGSTKLRAVDCCDPNSPFREGEGWADEPATCENIAYWAERAPTTNARISLAIKGKLSAVDAGVLARHVRRAGNAGGLRDVRNERHEAR
jgi:hypothetical protein